MGLDRRKFLALSALGSVAAPALFAGEGMIANGPQRAKEGFVPKGAKPEFKRTVCTFCSVGCGVVAEVVDGVWLTQVAAMEHPFSTGGHCCKGADMIDHVRSENRLRFPVKKVDGKWLRTDYKSSMKEICDQLKQIRKESGPDSVMIIGSAKVSNEQSYYIRKFAAFMGTNNIDHQARI